MNAAMKAVANWAEIAGLFNAGNGHAFIRRDGRPVATLYLDKAVADEVVAWLRKRPLKVTVDRGRNPHRIRCSFMGSEAAKVLNMTFGRLREPALQARAALIMRYWKTLQKPGYRLPEKDRAEREAIAREFKKLKTA